MPFCLPQLRQTDENERLNRKSSSVYGRRPRNAPRLIAIQVLSIFCFLAFPLRCTFVRPPVGGWAGDLFAGLLKFDRPFNQAPSLHAALPVILWMRYRVHTHRAIRVLLAAWFVLVTASALTTYQQAYAAGARILTVVDQLYQTLLGIQ